MRREWTKTEAAKALGITARTIHFYTDAGLLTPDVANPKGKGTTRRYSAHNLFEFAVIRELAALGLPLSRIKNAMLLVNFWDHPELFTPETASYLKDVHQDEGVAGADQGTFTMVLVGFDVYGDNADFEIQMMARDEVRLSMTRNGRRATNAIVVDLSSIGRKILSLLA